MVESLHELGLSSSSWLWLLPGFAPEVIRPLVEHLEKNKELPVPVCRFFLVWEKLFLTLPSSAHTLHAVSQTMLLEKLRVARRPASEATFNVFYYLLACGDGTLR